MARPNKNLKSKIDTYLSASDQERLANACKLQRRTRSEIARDAIITYLNRLDAAKENKNDSETARAIKSMTDRICGMLARQGTQTGTLFELAWQNHAESNQQERFIAATNLVKSNLRKRLEKDELEISQRMKGVVEK